jgi:tetratricopeptide (TPR) repeat protein
MITQLGRLHPQSLSVIARTSVMRYKKAEAPVDRIGRELGVDHVLEGSVQREGGRIRIAADLVRVRDQTQLWADTYERELSGILTVQSQVAQSVARALAIELLPPEQARLASTRTVNPEAYEAFLRGYALWQRLNAGSLDDAQRWLEAAIEKDPSYAPAHAGLAWVWLARGQMGIVPYSEAPKVRAAALQALALDEACSEAHEVLASFLTWSEWDWAGAEKEWARALELNPNSANTQAYYAHFLANRGRAAEGVRHSERAIRLDPFNALYHALYGVVLFYLERHDDALAAARAALAIDSRQWVALSQFRQYYFVKGMRDELLAEVRTRIANDPERIAAFERGLREGGHEGAHRGVADVLAAQYEDGRYKSANGVALRYLDAGDREKAIEWLYKACENHDQNLPYLGTPQWASLRGDPRFQALARRIGIPLPGGG